MCAVYTFFSQTILTTAQGKTKIELHTPDISKLDFSLFKGHDGHQILFQNQFVDIFTKTVRTRALLNFLKYPMCVVLTQKYET